MCPLIIYNKEGIRVDKYNEILYDRLFTLIDDLLELSEDLVIIQVMDKNFFLFRQDNTIYFRAIEVLNSLENIILLL